MLSELLSFYLLFLFIFILNFYYLFIFVYIATTFKNVYNRQNTLPMEVIYFPSICTSLILLTHLFNVNRVGREIAVRENVVF